MEEFVSADEQQKAVIGGGYLSNILQTGILGKGFGVLTERPSETETPPKLMQQRDISWMTGKAAVI